MSAIKQKAKQVPFNPSLPWGDSIAQQMGTSVEELTANFPNDPSLDNTINSTCSMVRDFAVQELIKKNKRAAIMLNDICYGHGMVMHEGVMVPTGACKRKVANIKNEAGEIESGDGVNHFGKTCEVKEGDQFVRHRTNFGPAGMKPLTTIQKVKNYNKLGEQNTTGLGAPDQVLPEGVVFLQKNKGSSNEDIPMYTNASLSGKGYTQNTAPQQRYETKINDTTFHPDAYKSKPEGEEEAAAEEENALGEDKDEIKNNDQLITVTKMVVPDQVCNLICAGLVIQDLMEEGAVIDPPTEPKVTNTPQMNNPDMNTPEGMHLNTFRYGVDSRVSDAPPAEVPNTSQKYDGTQECQDSAPKTSECIEKGGEVAHWIMERIINTNSFCDYESGDCSTLFV